MCQPKMSHGCMHMPGWNRGCCGCGPVLRNFVTTAEELEELRHYRNQLEKELAGVQEHIRELKEP